MDFDYLLTQYEKAENFVRKGDFKKNGVWYCGICKTPKQTVIEFPVGSGIFRKPFSTCKCIADEEKAVREKKEREAAERRRTICFPDYPTSLQKFEADKGISDPKAMQSVRNYAENFEIMYHEKHLGLMLYGDVGTGKSFAAACIANSVLDRGYTCYFTDFDTIFNDLWDAKEKSIFLNELASYDLLVIDDFGVERESDYTNEIITKVINARCRNGKPMILTTNLTPAEINPSNLEDRNKQRIYSRLFQMVMPIKFEGADNRLNIMYQNAEDVKELLGL